jgi:hypothetical protein
MIQSLKTPVPEHPQVGSANGESLENLNLECQGGSIPENTAATPVFTLAHTSVLHPFCLGTSPVSIQKKATGVKVVMVTNLLCPDPLAVMELERKASKLMAYLQRNPNLLVSSQFWVSSVVYKSRLQW